MAQPQFLKIEKTGGVARITFNRPKHNVFNIDMMNELNAEFQKIEQDPQLKCVVLLGEGPSWSAGVEVLDHKPAMVADMIAAFNRMFIHIEKIEVPLIAAVHGICLGGGMELAIACDIVIASAKASFGQPEIKLGFLPPYAAIRLPQLVGVAKTIEICTTGRRYSAEEAQHMGFITHVVASDQFEGAVNKLVTEIEANSPLIIRLNKRAVKQHLGLSFQAAIEGVSSMFLDELMKTEDTLEGIASFEEKRRPVWKNR